MNFGGTKPVENRQHGGRLAFLEPAHHDRIFLRCNWAKCRLAENAGDGMWR